MCLSRRRRCTLVFTGREPAASQIDFDSIDSRNQCATAHRVGTFIVRVER
jgi:hypothetical protein